MKFHTMHVWSSIGTQKWPGASVGVSGSPAPNSETGRSCVNGMM